MCVRAIKPMLKSPEFDINPLGTGVNSFTGMKHQEFPQHSPAPDHLCDLTMDRLGQTSNDSETARFPLRHGTQEGQTLENQKMGKQRGVKMISTLSPKMGFDQIRYQTWTINEHII